MRRACFFFLLLCNSCYSFAQNIEDELANLYSEKKYDLLFEKAVPILKENPQNPTLNLIVGRALVDQKKIDEGEPYIENAIEYSINNSWQKAWALCYLGQIEFFKDNIKAAKKSLEECNAMNATKNVSNRSKNYLMMWGLDNFYRD